MVHKYFDKNRILRERKSASERVGDRQIPRERKIERERERERKTEKERQSATWKRLSP